MKKIQLFIMICFCMMKVSGQIQKYDMLTYTPIKEWKKDTTETLLSYSITDKKTKTFCQISILKSTGSKGSIEKDFDSEWQELIVKAYKPTETPVLNEVQKIDSGNTKAGVVGFKFNNKSALAMLTTITGYGRCASIVATTSNTGTYTYVIKNYVEDDKETLLTRESGVYTVNGNIVTLNPKTNVIEAWSKKNGGDNYNQLLSSQQKALEKTTYRFTIHYFPELKESGLVLISNYETMRDGKYNAGDAFPHGWRFSPAGPNYKPIKLPGE